MNIQAEAAFRPPMESRATRKIALRSRTSCRSTLTAYLPAVGHTVKIRTESKIEESYVYLTIIRPDVVDIWDQPQPIHYHDNEGKLRTHYYDFLVTDASGEQEAVVVKPWAKASRPEFRKFVKRLADHTPRVFADRVSIFTERSYSKTEVKNAKRLFTASRETKPDIDAQLLDAARNLHGITSIRSFLSTCDLGGKGYNGVLRMITKGTLSLASASLITPDSKISWEVSQ